MATDLAMRTLADCEAVIARGLTTFVEVGQALLAIRDGRLYQREAGYSDFETYCRERWGWSRVHAHRQIEAAKVAAVLPIGNTPKNEAQARELARLPDDDSIRKTWAEVENQHPNSATAAHVREAVDRRLGVTRIREIDAQNLPEDDLPSRSYEDSVPLDGVHESTDVVAASRGALALVGESPQKADTAYHAAFWRMVDQCQSGLTTFDPERVAGLHDATESEGARLFIASLRRWLDAYEAALSRGLRIAEGAIGE